MGNFSSVAMAIAMVAAFLLLAAGVKLVLARQTRTRGVLTFVGSSDEQEARERELRLERLDTRFVIPPGREIPLDRHRPDRRPGPEPDARPGVRPGHQPKR